MSTIAANCKIKKRAILSLLVAAIGLSGCSQIRFPAAYKIDLAQGNILEQDQAEQLQPGMTQRQVVYLLGTPVMKTTFEPNTWHYIYQFSKEGAVPERYELTLTFEGKILKTINGDLSKIKDWHKQKKA